MKNLVIVESPAKKKPIEKYLGKDYEVKASFGHVRDLPSKPGSVLPEKDFSLKYLNNDKSKKHIQDIIASAKVVDKIYLATDPDREGEAIAWHIAEILKEKKLVKRPEFIKRISFNEITKKAVTEAINNPRDIDINLVNAQQARRALDYLVGFTLSPILWRKLPGARSAGRVQSVALRLICEREDEIEKFKSEEYWNININLLNTLNNPFVATITHANKEKLDKFTINNKEKAEELTKSIKTKAFYVDSIETKQQKRTPPSPFITSTMQQEAARKLGFSAKKTMQIAQKLYEGIEIDGETVGLITYMRTDGVTLAEEALLSIRSVIENKFGKKYLPAKARIYKSKLKNVQEAHEAIRPTNILLTPDEVKDILDKDYLKLYDLIWKRTLACQMENVVLSLVSAKLITNDEQFEAKATGSTIVFDGFYKVYKEGADEEEEESKLLPPLKEKEQLTLTKVTPVQHFTEPPPKYSEASIIKKLEELGIGRPSTLVSILSVLQERDYAKLIKKKFFPSEKGRLVTAFLIGFFKKYVGYDFTALLESELDDVSAGNLDWKKLLKNFWEGFNQNINEATNLNIKDVILYLEQELEHHLFAGNETNKICPNCTNGKLGLKLGKFGAFLGCSNYPECNFNKSIMTTAENEAEIEENTNLPKSDNNKLLGTNEKGSEVFLKKGPYGWYIQEGEQLEKTKKPKRTAIPSSLSIENINLDIANKLLNLPMLIGKFNNEDILLGIGKYGPYLKYQEHFVSIPKSIDIFNLSENVAVEIIKKSKKIKNSK